MNIKISFHNLPHSDALENHARDKMSKIQTFFKNTEESHPLSMELFLNAQTSHSAHHTVELIARCSVFKLATHAEGSDMYVAVDAAIDKMVTLVKKEKAKMIDKQQQVVTEKTAFSH